MRGVQERSGAEEGTRRRSIWPRARSMAHSRSGAGRSGKGYQRDDHKPQLGKDSTVKVLREPNDVGRRKSYGQYVDGELFSSVHDGSGP